jgi:kinesin family protein 3/17
VSGTVRVRSTSIVNLHICFHLQKLEVEMRQQIEVQEESAVEILETYTTLQQEVEIKTKKLKKLFAKLQAVKQEIHDVTDEFNRDRRELELTQNDLMK